MIKQSSIDNLLSQVSIVDVIGSRIDLTKSGRNYTALCPFHEEKTPSFSVSEDKEMCFCFGCKAGGNVIQFIMDYESVPFPEAVMIIAQENSFTLEYEAKSVNANKSSANSISEDEAITLLKVVHNTFVKRRERQHESPHSYSSISKQVEADNEVGYAHPNQTLFKLINNDPKLKKIANHIGLFKYSVSSEDERTITSLPIRNSSGQLLGLYLDNQKSIILGPKSINYNNYFYGSHSLNRTTDAKFIVDSPITVLKCLNAGMQDVISPVTSSQIFNRKHVEAGNKKKTYIIMSQTPKNMEALRNNLLSYFQGRKSKTNLSVMMLPPHISIADIYSKHGMPVMNTLLENAITWDKLLGRLLSDELIESNKNNEQQVSDFIYNLYLSSKMDNDSLIYTVFISSYISKHLSLNDDSVFKKTLEYVEKARVSSNIEKQNAENIKQIDEMIKSVSGVQLSSLNRIVALVSININEIESNEVVLENLKQIHFKLNESESAFSKMMASGESSGFYSSSVLYRDFTEEQRLAIGREVGFLMEFKRDRGSIAELNDSIAFVCQKLNIQYIDNIVFQPAELNLAF
jgi:DNA primase catalytic core